VELVPLGGVGAGDSFIGVDAGSSFREAHVEVDWLSKGLPKVRCAGRMRPGLVWGEEDRASSSMARPSPPRMAVGSAIKEVSSVSMSPKWTEIGALPESTLREGGRAAEGRRPPTLFRLCEQVREQV
jgi:hypothetical protein